MQYGILWLIKSLTIIKEKTIENWNICKIDKLVYKSVIVKLVMVTTLATKKKIEFTRNRKSQVTIELLVCLELFPSSRPNPFSPRTIAFPSLTSELSNGCSLTGKNNRTKGKGARIFIDAAGSNRDTLSSGKRERPSRLVPINGEARFSFKNALECGAPWTTHRPGNNKQFIHLITSVFDDIAPVCLLKLIERAF